MNFKSFFINSLAFLSISLFLVSAGGPKSDTQFKTDLDKAHEKITQLTNSNQTLSIRFCDKIMQFPNNLYYRYHSFSGIHTRDNIDPDFIKSLNIWAKNYEIMGLPGFSDLVDSTEKGYIDDILEANHYVYDIYRRLYFEFGGTIHLPHLYD